MNTLSYYSTLILMTATLSMAAQGDQSTANTSLKQQYEQLKDESNNYQIYKVVNEQKLDAFWATVADTLKSNQAQIDALHKEVAQLNKEVASLSKQVSERDSSLAAQEHKIDHMSFLGLSLTKAAYITLTWSFIIVLLIIAFVLYYRFNAANRITTAKKKDYDTLATEYEAHKQKCRETETKLKRELQTEINKVVELKEQLGEP